jgi:Na+-transporting methylmalonyl-CoA/oxaloacetate decarboxylase gamma subunit
MTTVPVVLMVLMVSMVLKVLMVLVILMVSYSSLNADGIRYVPTHRAPPSKLPQKPSQSSQDVRTRRSGDDFEVAQLDGKS